ncbi:P-loop ATPase, Sll1717 family [Rufibacter soli]
MTRKNNQTKSQNKFKFNKHLTIGAPDAESDYNLDKVFVENGELETLESLNSAKCIIVGRTGAGKSALIKQLEETLPKVRRIEPESMSIKYLSNSTIITYLLQLDVNLNFFYKVLWKHVFIVELLKLYFDEDISKRKNWLQSIYDKVQNKFGKVNPAKAKAIAYLENWSDEFWQYREHRIKSLEDDLTQKLQSEVGATDLITLKAIIEESKTTKTSTEIKHKAEKVINEIQAEELYEIINILKTDLFDDSQKKFYLIIDDLDKEWVSPQIVYDLIAAMVEVIKEFQVFKSAKIIVALRDNLHQLVFTAREHRGGQREKFSSLYLYLTWDRGSLKELLDRRLKLISNNIIDIKTTFERKNSNNESGFDYILDRTFLRPRDVISFVNKIIQNANSKSHFTNSIIKLAEPEYSIERFQAIEDEWNENYGDIKRLTNFLTGIHNGFRLRNIKEDSFYELYCDEDAKGFKGDFKNSLILWQKGKLKFREFIKEVLYILYKVGIIGIKKPNSSIQFSYENSNPILVSDFDSDCRIYVHKAFYSVLSINVKALEVDYLD